MMALITSAIWRAGGRSPAASSAAGTRRHRAILAGSPAPPNDHVGELVCWCTDVLVRPQISISTREENQREDTNRHATRDKSGTRLRTHPSTEEVVSGGRLGQRPVEVARRAKAGESARPTAALLQRPVARPAGGGTRRRAEHRRRRAVGQEGGGVIALGRERPPNRAVELSAVARGRPLQRQRADQRPWLVLQRSPPPSVRVRRRRRPHRRGTQRAHRRRAELRGLKGTQPEAIRAN